MLQKVQVSSSSTALSASAVATVNTNTSPLMRIFHQYNKYCYEDTINNLKG